MTQLETLSKAGLTHRARDHSGRLSGVNLNAGTLIMIKLAIALTAFALSACATGSPNPAGVKARDAQERVDESGARMREEFNALFPDA